MSGRTEGLDKIMLFVFFVFFKSTKSEERLSECFLDSEFVEPDVMMEALRPNRRRRHTQSSSARCSVRHLMPLKRGR